jgi:hypothetical protein
MLGPEKKRFWVQTQWRAGVSSSSAIELDFG